MLFEILKRIYWQYTVIYTSCSNHRVKIEGSYRKWDEILEIWGNMTVMLRRTFLHSSSLPKENTRKSVIKTLQHGKFELMSEMLKYFFFLKSAKCHLLHLTLASSTQANLNPVSVCFRVCVEWPTFLFRKTSTSVKYVLWLWWLNSNWHTPKVSGSPPLHCGSPWNSVSQIIAWSLQVALNLFLCWDKIA